MGTGRAWAGGQWGICEGGGWQVANLTVGSPRAPEWTPQRLLVKASCLIIKLLPDPLLQPDLLPARVC